MDNQDIPLPGKDSTWRTWHVPLSANDWTLAEVLHSASHMAAGQDDIPLIVQLVENPKFDIPGLALFNGAVGLETHDYIHALLGRGMLPKDEAFVIGFTMGSTNRVTNTEEKLYSLAARYLYPGPFRFGDEEIQIFKDAVRLGYVSDCKPLDEVDYSRFVNKGLQEVRDSLGIERDLIKAYYKIEKKRHPDDPACRRLLN